MASVFTLTVFIINPTDITKPLSHVPDALSSQRVSSGPQDGPVAVCLGPSANQDRICMLNKAQESALSLSSEQDTDSQSSASLHPHSL